LFLYTIEIDQATLPAGVELISKTFPYGRPWQKKQPDYFITNKSKIPIYLFEDSGYPAHFDPKDKPLYGDSYIFPNSEIPEEFKPIFKLQNSMVYFYGQLNYKDPRGYILDCEEGSDCYLEFSKTSPNIGIDIDEAVIYQDNRPKEVVVPEPKEFSINVFYEGKPSVIKGTIHFTLNKDYDPTIFARTWQQGVDACSRWVGDISKP
jgi:hypothetical protein